MRTAVATAFVALFLSSAVHAETIGTYAAEGPFTHDNLTLYVLRGPDTTTQELVTLDEALAAKSITVRETSEVNQLTVQNKGKKAIYMQAGEIVKGGKQDRVLQNDTIVEPLASTSVKVYCVEQGRWHGRGHESATQFQASTKQLVGKAALAPRVEKNQSKVWASVAEKQQALVKATGVNVQNNASPTSMQLSLENDNVVKAAAAYKKAFEKLPAAHTDVIGFAYAVNGKPEAIEVLANHALLIKQWAKLIDGVATQAVSAIGDAASSEPVTTASFTQMVDDADASPAEVDQAAPNMQVQTKQSRDNVVIESKSGDKAVRKTYVKK